MGKIKYVDGDATRPRGEGKKIIVHVCKNYYIASQYLCQYNK
jgi:hypothetical protein